MMMLCVWMMWASADSLWEQSLSSYDKGEYEQAAKTLEDLAESAPSIDVYYNLGTVSFRQGKLGWAIYFYEKALRYDPMDEDIRNNLDVCRSMIVDRIEEPPAPKWIAAIRTWMYLWHVTAVKLIAAVLWCLLWVGWAIHHTRWRLPLWVRAIAVFAAVVIFSWAGVRMWNEQRVHRAVLVRPVVEFRAEPRAEATVLMTLHEGTQGIVRSSQGEWVEIEIADGRAGWVRWADAGVL